MAVQFSEPVDAATATAGFTLATATGPVAGALQVAPDGRSLTYNPAALLASDTVYTLTVAATVEDLSGAPMAAPFVATFRTVVWRR